MADILGFSPLRALDWNGDPVPGAVASFYLSGTTTPATVYQDQAGTVPYGVTVEADSRGVFPAAYSSVSLKVVVVDSEGTILPGYPMDPVYRSPVTGSSADLVSFAPTARVPSTDVQAAIEQVDANIGADLRAAGFGVTGDAAALVNLDATGTASGRYRIAASTSGTFPAGMAAADGGIVDFIRETAARASQTILHGTTERRATRDLTAGVWTAWREDVTVNQPLARGDLLRYGASNFERLAKGATGQVLKASGTDAVWGSVAPDIVLADVKASGTSGGTSTTGSDVVRVINTKVRDAFSLCTLAANQFTLEAGSYYIRARAAGYAVNANQLLLWNATGATELLRGDSCLTGSQVIFAELNGTFTVAASQALELRHRFQSGVSDGMGVPASFGAERYATIELWRA